jgi:hypothetical protein
MADALSPTMTLRDFENGYWYVEQLRDFAGRIGIPAAKKLRKVELERPSWRSCVRGRLQCPRHVHCAEAIAAWTELKELDVPKDYSS